MQQRRIYEKSARFWNIFRLVRFLAIVGGFSYLATSFSGRSQSKIDEQMHNIGTSAKANLSSADTLVHEATLDYIILHIKDNLYIQERNTRKPIWSFHDPRRDFVGVQGRSAFFNISDKVVIIDLISGRVSRLADGESRGMAVAFSSGPAKILDFTLGSNTLARTRGTMRITVGPKDAVISVDGVPVAEGAHELTNVMSGFYELAVNRSGCAGTQQIILVESGLDSSIHVELDCSATIAWTTGSQSEGITDVISNGGFIYTVEADGFSVLGSRTGNRLWEIDGGLSSGPLLSDQTVYWAYGDTVFAAAAQTGVLIWQKRIKGNIRWIEIAHDIVVAAGSRGRLLGLNSHTGNIVWRRRNVDLRSSLPTINENRIYYRTSKRRLVSLAVNSEKVIWKERYGDQVAILGIGVAGVFTFAPATNTLFQHDLASGTLINVEKGIEFPPVAGSRWLVNRRTWKSGDSQLVMLNAQALDSAAHDSADALYLAEGNAEIVGLSSATLYLREQGQIRAIEAGSGAIKWTMELPTMEDFRLYQIRENLYLAYSRDLKLLNINSGKEIWGVQFPDMVQLVASTDGGILLVSGERLYKMKI